MMNMKLLIGPTLKRILAEKRLKLREVGLATGVPPSTIAEWASNRAPKNPVHALAVAKFLGVSLHYLLFGEEDEQEPIQKILKTDLFNGTFEITLKKVNFEEKK